MRRSATRLSFQLFLRTTVYGKLTIFEVFPILRTELRTQGTKLIPLSRFLRRMDAAAQMPGFLSFRPFGFAEAKRTRWKKGAFSFISWSTAFQEKFSTPSLVADLSIEGLALEQRFLHSFEMSEQTRSSMAFLRLGLSITASARALKLLPLASPFPSRCSSFGKSPVFRPDSYVIVA